ncbi:putative amidophosphoribosyl-transferase [Polaribacter irgensii 23-P]|uniref:Putative amidophosphoribosyl-transferase n=2 Tax=Polaribacter TaxID=52959 RepID=A4BWD4_9FLAO|nr:putative amidophosphoribosyl-transferase [Polaribacter irgensii 23-P]
MNATILSNFRMNCNPQKMELLKDLRALFYPRICANCSQQLIQNESIICTFCRHDLPLTHFQSYTKNKINAIFYGRVTIEKAFALLFLRKKGITKNLIHKLKYQGTEEIGIFFGNWIGEILSENEEFSTVDFILPVPIHAKKQKIRGYNQVTKFGKCLQRHLKTPFLENVLVRKSANTTQTFKSRFERFNDLDTKFSLLNFTIFKDKHVLIIDDVVTTGATLEACALELLKTSGIRISILTMAYTE